MRRVRFWIPVVVLLCVGAGSAAAQDRSAPDPLTPVDWLVGRWEGTSHGQPGQGKVTRRYERVLGGRFIALQNTSRWAPTKDYPAGEVHEDRGFISYDRARHRLVFRQFHVEGFVNTYVADGAVAGQGVVRFTAEAIENIPAGWRARETWTRTGPDTFTERFELAEPGKELELYSETSLHRVGKR